MAKSLGYILGILGLVLIFLPLIPSIKDAIPVINGMNQWIIIGAGAVLVLLAVFMLRSSGREQPREIPIYEGQGEERKVVGIQRVGGE